MRDIYLAHGAPYLRHDLLHSVLMDMDFVKDYIGYMNYFLYKKALFLFQWFRITCCMLNLSLIIFKLKLQ